MFKRIKTAGKRLKTNLSKFKKNIVRNVDKRPFLSFFVALGILVTLIVISNVLGAPQKAVEKAVVQVKPVHVYSIGSAPTMSVQAQIRKSGVIKITSLTGGVVQRLYKQEGETFYRGQTLVGLSSNYQGGNLAGLQRRLSQIQRNNVVDTLQMQKDLIGKQKQLSEEVDEAAGETDLSELQEDVTKKQLDLQEKQLDLGKEAAEIQLQIAQVAEASMYPSAPFVGVVDKVYVKVGQNVSPGTVLMQISEDIKADPVTAMAFVSAHVAQNVSRAEPSVVHIGSEALKILPFHVSQDAVEGLLYAIYYDIPEDYRSQVTEDGFITIDIPVGEADASATVPFVPIDAVYQTKDRNYLYVVNKGKAESRAVDLGQVLGSYVEVLSGLKEGDEVIVDRTVIAGDTVTIVK